MWEDFKKQGNPIPEYLKNLLTITGYQSIDTVAMLNIGEIEKFAQESLTQLINAKDHIKYFGPLFGEPNMDKRKFIIVPGHKILLKLLIERCQLFAKNNKRENGVTITTKYSNNSTARPCSSSSANAVGQQTGHEAKILNLISTYIQNQKKGDKNVNFWQQIEEDKIRVIVKENVPCAECIICKELVKICYLPNTHRWIISNYARHLGHHIPGNKGTISKIKKRFKSSPTHTPKKEKMQRTLKSLVASGGEGSSKSNGDSSAECLDESNFEDNDPPDLLDPLNYEQKFNDNINANGIVEVIVSQNGDVVVENCVNKFF